MKMYHIGFSKADAGEYAILTGDPGRVEHIAKFLDNSRFVAQNREYTTYVGYIDNVKVNIMSVGMGGPSMAIGVEEMVKLGCKNFIRVGTCGGINLDVKAGDVVIANAAIRQEGTGYDYLPICYPAVANFEVTAALKQAVEKCQLNTRCHVGVVQSKDSFYGEMESERMPLKEQLQNLWEVYKRVGVLGSEMECAALFITATTLGARAGGILLAVWNEERRRELGDDTQVLTTDPLYKVAVEAVRNLIQSR